jgi:hypothetical protein
VLLNWKNNINNKICSYVDKRCKVQEYHIGLINTLLVVSSTYLAGSIEDEEKNENLFVSC